MRSPGPRLDVLRTVSRRRSLLAALENGPSDKRALCESLECSRSTIDRGIRELEWLQFVRCDDGSYRLTTAGKLALAEHRHSTDVLESIAGTSDLLADVPRDAPMSAALLTGARTMELPSHAPMKPLQSIVDLVESADRVRGLKSAERIPRLRKRLRDRVVDGGLDGEAVVTFELARYVRETYPDWFREVVVDGGFDFYAVESIPYELALVETPTASRVFLFVLDESTAIQGVVENDTEAAFEWGERVFRRFRESATSLP